MSKANIIPNTDDKRLTFYPKFGNNIDEALTTMGLDPDMGANAKTQALAWGPSYEAQQDALKKAKAATVKQEKQNDLSHDAVQNLLDQIRNHPKYTADIQALLGTQPEKTDPKGKAGADQPVITLTLQAGHPELKCRKNGHSQIKILCKRGSETEYSLLTIVTSPKYVDLRPNLLPTQPEQRSYLMIYVDRDQETGQYSQPATVAVLGQP
jgi:hypothetical protein